MPESPEVDALGAFLRDTLRGAAVSTTDLAEFRALKTRARPLSQLEGAVVDDVRRFGKHLALLTDGPTLVISFGRAGWATWQGEGAPPADSVAPEIATLVFDDRGTVGLTDAGEWLSLGLSVVDEPAEVPAIAKLGPDPAGPAFSRADLDRIVSGRRKQLKALLQEQESLAGIGNAYSDEILYVARLSPLVQAAALGEDDRERLYAAIRTVLIEAFDARRGVPIAQQKAAKVAAMRVHGRTGEPCPEGEDIVRDVPGSHGRAQYCAACQTGGVVLAD